MAVSVGLLLFLGAVGLAWLTREVAPMKIGATRLQRGLEAAGADKDTAENAAAVIGEMYVYVSKFDARMGIVIPLLIAILASIIAVGGGVLIQVLTR